MFVRLHSFGVPKHSFILNRSSISFPSQSVRLVSVFKEKHIDPLFFLKKHAQSFKSKYKGHLTYQKPPRKVINREIPLPSYSQLVPPAHSRNEIYFPNFPVAITKNGIASAGDSTIQEKYRKVTFKVQPHTGKKDLQRYLQQVYKLDVAKIHTVNLPVKWKRLRKKGRLVKRGKRVKKAFVWVKLDYLFPKDAEQAKPVE